MNTVSFTPLPETGQVRVTIHSSGERDQSALIALSELEVEVAALQQDAPSGEAPHEPSGE